MTSYIYRNPPIDEAICQFTYANPITWDADIPRRLFLHLKNRYPALPSQQQLLQANLTSPVAVNPPDLSVVPTERFVFLSEDGTKRLSVSPHAIGFHQAKPYESFKESLLPRIVEQLPEVLDSLGCEGNFNRVSVRYINRIIVDLPSIDIQEYFNYPDSSSFLPEPFQNTLSAFFYRTVTKPKDQLDELAVTFGSASSPKDSVAFILDIDIAHSFENPADVTEAIEQVKSLRELENSVFESLITDKCRELFK